MKKRQKSPFFHRGTGNVWLSSYILFLIAASKQNIVTTVSSNMHIFVYERLCCNSDRTIVNPVLRFRDNLIPEQEKRLARHQ